MTATLPHAEWQQTQYEADGFADQLREIIDTKLATVPPQHRNIYCQHLANLGGKYGFEVRAARPVAHGKDCGCDGCLDAIFGRAV